MKAFELVVRRDLLNPYTVTGAVTSAVLMLLLAWIAARAVRLTVHEMLARTDRDTIDRTSVLFLTQLAQIMIYIVALTFYAHLIPELRSVGTALLTSVGVASIVVGLAAQNTLGNIVAGVSLIIYRPFQVDDQIQVTAPTGLETGVVESLSLGYTVLRTFDHRRVVIPNSIMATQATVNLTSQDLKVMLADRHRLRSRPGLGAEDPARTGCGPCRCDISRGLSSHAVGWIGGDPHASRVVPQR